MRSCSLMLLTAVAILAIDEPIERTWLRNGLITEKMGILVFVFSSFSSFKNMLPGLKAVNIHQQQLPTTDDLQWRSSDREEACLPVQLLLTPLFADGWRDYNGSKSLRALLSEAGLLTEYMKRERGVNDELTTRLQRICEDYASNGKQIKSNRQKRFVGASLALHAAQAAWNIKQDLDLRAVQNELKEQAEMLRSLKEATSDKNRLIQLTKRAEQRLNVLMQLESHLKEKKSAFLHSLETLFHTHRVHNELLSATELNTIIKMIFGDDGFQQSAYSEHRYITLFYVTVVPRSCDIAQNVIHSDICAPFIATNELRTLYQTAKIARFINESRFFVLTDVPKYIATTVNRTTEAVILSDLCQRKGGYVYDCPVSQLDTSECEVNTLNNCVVHVRRVSGSFTHVQRLRDLYVVATNEKSFIIGNSTIWFHQKVYSPVFTLKVARNCIARIGNEVLIGTANTTSFLQHYQTPLQIYVDELTMAEFDQLTEKNEALIAKLNAHERKVVVAIAALDKSLFEKAYDLILNSSFSAYLCFTIIAIIALCGLYLCCCRCGPICKPSNARQWYHHRVFTVRSASDCEQCCGDNV